MDPKSGWQDPIRELKNKIDYTVATLESSIVTLATCLRNFKNFLASLNHPHLLCLAIELRDTLIQRYLLIERLFENQVYLQITLGARLAFAEVLKSNCKVVRQHYYSSCVHYPDKGSLKHVLFSLSTRLKILSRLKREMEQFDERILQELNKISLHSSCKTTENCLGKLLALSKKGNKELRVLIEGLQVRVKERERQISAAEKKYFLELAQKFHSEVWMSQEEIQKKVFLEYQQHRTPRKSSRTFRINWCCSKRKENFFIEQPYKFVLDPEEFKEQVKKFF